MLDETMRQFEAEMQSRSHLRSAGTRGGGEVNTLSGAGAACLARRIRDFWRAAGFEVETEVVLIAGGHPPTYGIRSNLKNRLPRATAQPTGRGR